MSIPKYLLLCNIRILSTIPFLLRFYLCVRSIDGQCFIFLNQIPNVLFLAPAAAPTNISLLVLGPQSINVTICPPAAIDQNGLILSYNVSYTGDPFDALIQSQSFAVSLSYPTTACVNVTLTGLEEFNNYTVSVQAVNSAGSGVSSTGVVAQTNTAGS